MKLEDFLKSDRVTHLKVRDAVIVSKKTPIRDVMVEMREHGRGCALIMDKKKMLGIFTERDALQRVAGPGLDTKTPIENVMTPKPKSLKISQSIGSAIKLMNEGRYRHVPLIDKKEEVLGFISVKDVVRYLASFFPLEVYNLPPDPNQVPSAPEGA